MLTASLYPSRKPIWIICAVVIFLFLLASATPASMRSFAVGLCSTLFTISAGFIVSKSFQLSSTNFLQQFFQVRIPPSFQFFAGLLDVFPSFRPFLSKPQIRLAPIRFVPNMALPFAQGQEVISVPPHRFIRSLHYMMHFDVIRVDAASLADVVVSHQRLHSHLSVQPVDQVLSWGFFVVCCGPDFRSPVLKIGQFRIHP